MKQRNKDHFLYAIYGIVFNTNLTFGTRLILSMVYTYVRQHNQCTMSNRTFALRTGYSKRQVSRVIRKLEKQGWFASRNTMYTFPNGSKQRIRVIYDFNQNKLNQARREVSQRISKRNKFKNLKFKSDNNVVHKTGSTGNTVVHKNSTTLVPKTGSTVVHKSRTTLMPSMSTIHKNIGKSNNKLSYNPSDTKTLRLNNRNRLDKKSKIGKNTKSKNRNTKSKIEDKYLGTNIKLESYSNGRYKAPSTVFNTLSLLFRHFKHNIEYLHTSQSSINKCRKIISGWCDDNQAVRDNALNAIVKSASIHAKRFPNILYLVKVIDNNYVQKFYQQYIDKQRAADKEQKEIARDQKDIRSGMHQEIVTTANNILAEYHDGIVGTKDEDLEECKGQDPKVKALVVKGLRKMNKE